MMQQPERPLRAVALRYDQACDTAPQVVAAGRGAVAERIVAAARAAGIDIVEDRDLMEVLRRIPVGDDIPAELFAALAEILAFVYRINGRYSGMR
jgi:flagellar biosynthesis protein